MQPGDYHLPHSTWREYQEESIEWCLSVNNTGVIEAPTGSGKTSFAAAVGVRKSVVALCRTKNLQVTNYQDGYGFDVLFGRDNYDCAHPDYRGATCGDCPFAPRMYRCPYARECPYLVQKAKVKASPKASLNYAYWLSAAWPRKNPPQVVFLDEAHNLSDVVLDWVGCTVTERERVEFNLPQFPDITHRNQNVLLRLPPPVDLAVPWLEQVRHLMRIHYKTLSQHPQKYRKQLKQCERLGRKVAATLEGLKTCRDDWYVRSGSTALSFRGDRRPGFVARPLTARHHFAGRFLDGHATVAVSATIGDPCVFAEELGITQYRFRVVPNRFPAEVRPVHVLDCPSMSREATAKDFEYQADAIAKAVLGCDPSWSGLIHVTRKREARLLADRLARRGLQDRVWVTPGWDGVYSPTDEQLAAWERRKGKVSNSICLSWAFWEGYDGLDERLNIIAKIPFPFLGSEYETERLHYDRKFFVQRTAWKAEQGLGRTRRGRPEDYDLDGEVRGYVAIADGSLGRVQKYLSKSLQEALDK